MPGFIKNIDQLKAKGYLVVACVSVNDPFVTGAWGKSLHADGKVRILADPLAEFTKVTNSIQILFTVKTRIQYYGYKNLKNK